MVIQGDEGRLLYIAAATEEGVKSRNKKCFLKCDGNLGIEMQLTIFFSIIMLGGVSQVMS